MRDAATLEDAPLAVYPPTTVSPDPVASTLSLLTGTGRLHGRMPASAAGMDGAGVGCGCGLGCGCMVPDPPGSATLDAAGAGPHAEKTSRKETVARKVLPLFHAGGRWVTSRYHLPNPHWWDSFRGSLSAYGADGTPNAIF